MSNEEHVEEMFNLAHSSGVFKQFLDKVTEKVKNNPSESFYTSAEYVFDKFIKEGLIDSELYMFI
jgi:hypothetical protein